MRQLRGGAGKDGDAAVGLKQGDADGFARLAVGTARRRRRGCGRCRGAGTTWPGTSGNGGAGERYPDGAEVIGEEARVTDLGERTGEQMLTKAPYEDPGGEGCRLLHAMISVVTIGEGDGVCFGIKALDATLTAQMRQPDADLLIGDLVGRTVVVLGQRRHTPSTGSGQEAT